MTQRGRSLARLYPKARPGVDFILTDNIIVFWDVVKLGPEPSTTVLDDADADGDVWEARQETIPLFKNEALARVKTTIPAFDSFDKVDMLRAMAVNGMLTAAGGWSADGVLVRDIVQYVQNEAVPRINGIGHPQLTVDQLQTVQAQVSDALPFAGVDGTDTGWP